MIDVSPWRVAVYGPYRKKAVRYRNLSAKEPCNIGTYPHKIEKRREMWRMITASLFDS